jgi:surfeit locus 1 family protein
MIRRIPIVATLVVALALAAMIALGVWQLQRKAEKERALDQWRANLVLPPAAYPVSNPADENYLFRTLSANCLRVADWRMIGGKLPDGRSGWRQIATCATGAEGPGLVVDIGMSADPSFKPNWRGGPVRGIAMHEPQSNTLIDRIMGKSVPPRLMIVASQPPQGLAPSPAPDPASVPNNHLSYAVQWFLFAAIAVIIYVLALRRRSRSA